MPGYACSRYHAGATYLRSQCVPNSPASSSAYLFELTRKKFKDVFPLPCVDVDVAQFLLVPLALLF